MNINIYEDYFMENITKAGISAKVKKQGIIKLTVIATVAVVGIIFSAYSLINSQYLFSLMYFIAACLGTIYSVMKINTILPPSIECDLHLLYMSTWDNCIFPYNVSFKPAWFADFIPAKTKCYEIPLCEISSVVIGSKAFIIRSLPDSNADAAFNRILHGNSRASEAAKRCDFFYVTLKSNSSFFMSVNGFDIDELYNIVDRIEHNVNALEFKTNIRLLRKKREAESHIHK